MEKDTDKFTVLEALPIVGLKILSLFQSEGFHFNASKNVSEVEEKSEGHQKESYVLWCPWMSTNVNLAIFIQTFTWGKAFGLRIIIKISSNSVKKCHNISLWAQQQTTQQLRVWLTAVKIKAEHDTQTEQRLI